MTDVAFDKTGTLTTGVMSLSEVFALGDRRQFLRMVGSVEAASEHPIGRAVALGAEEEGVLLSDVTGFGAIGGRGVTGAVDGIEVVRWAPPSCSPIVVSSCPMSSPTAWRRSRAKGQRLSSVAGTARRRG